MQRLNCLQIGKADRHMAVMDEFREEREALKHGTPKEKFNYFMDYYKWYVIIGVLVILAGIYTIREVMNRKETVLYASLLNTVELETADQYNSDFMDSVSLDRDQYQMLFDAETWIDVNSMDETTMANSQKIAAHLAAGELDLMITDTDSLTTYSYQEDFLTMEELLSPEQYERYQPYFYYIDQETVQEWHDYISDYDNLMLEIDFEFPDPRKPEEMRTPVAVGIFMDDCKGLKESYHFKSDDVAFCVFANSSHTETALEYLDYLMQH